MKPQSLTEGFSVFSNRISLIEITEEMYSVYSIAGYYY